jgi:sterol desaturase/sphingolipid hydroxylase (fatty acid hydroxylase superfamily)
MDSVAITAFIFIGGLAAWSFLEYMIHAWLSHTFRTFASPLHQVHHRDPRRVFTVGAWLPVGASWLCGLAFWGLAPAMVFYSGMVSGFVLYEFVHYRIHFRRPRNRLEAFLRERHLVHHYRASAGCFGVTSPLWDRIFSSEIAGDEMCAMRTATAVIPPLRGSTNLRMLPGFRAIDRFIS